MTAVLAASEWGALREVGYIYDDGLPRPVAARLTFDLSTLFIVAKADADDVQILTIPPAGRDVSVLSRRPWTDAIGRHILWFWELTNQSGHTDGVQMLFAEPPAADVCIQFVVSASQLEVHEVRAVDDALYEDYSSLET